MRCRSRVAAMAASLMFLSACSGLMENASNGFGLFGGGPDEPQIAASDQSLLEALRAEGNFTTLVGLVESAGLQKELRGSNTVFAPTDEAFAALPAEVNTRIRDNPDQVRALLQQHVVLGQALAADEIPEHLRAMGGEPLQVRLAEGGAPVIALAGGRNNPGSDPEVAMADRPAGAHIVDANIGFANGVIHGIDRVLLPGS